MTERHNLERTEEIPAWKISLTKVETMGMGPKKGTVIGWATDAPKKGHPYIVHLDQNTALKTSRVQEVRKTDNGFIIKTFNSVYQVEYMQRTFIRRHLHVNSELGVPLQG